MIRNKSKLNQISKGKEMDLRIEFLVKEGNDPVFLNDIFAIKISVFCLSVLFVDVLMYE